MKCLLLALLVCSSSIAFAQTDEMVLDCVAYDSKVIGDGLHNTPILTLFKSTKGNDANIHNSTDYKGLHLTMAMGFGGTQISVGDADLSPFQNLPREVVAIASFNKVKHTAKILSRVDTTNCVNRTKYCDMVDSTQEVEIAPNEHVFLECHVSSLIADIYQLLQTSRQNDIKELLKREAVQKK